MNQEELMARIDRYDWQLMPESERQLIENEISENEEFRNQVIQRRLENTAIKQLRLRALQAKMKTWREESEAEPVPEVEEFELFEVEEGELTPVVPIKPLRVLWFTPMQWAAAASLALLVVVGGNFWAKSNYGNAALAAEFSSRSGALQMGDENEIAGAGATEGVSDPVLYKNAQAEYKAANYQAAVDIYSKLTSDAYVNLAQVPLADAYFKLNDFDKAIAIYENILTDTSLEDRIVQQAEWKLVVAYIAAKKARNNVRFDALLNKMAQKNDHTYHQQALDLSQKVYAFWWQLVN